MKWLKGKAARGAGTSWHNPHRIVPSIRDDESNNILERLDRTSKGRTNVMQAYDNDRGPDALSRGWRIYYNLARPHNALGGSTPGEIAGLPNPGRLSGGQSSNSLRVPKQNSQTDGRRRRNAGRRPWWAPGLDRTETL